MFKQNDFMCRPCAEKLKSQGLVKIGSSVTNKQTCSNCGRRRFVYNVEYLKGKKMIVLPIKKIWFDKIVNREKPEEYRDIKPYWTERFNIDKTTLIEALDQISIRPEETHYLQKTLVVFKNGYSPNSPTCQCFVGIRVGYGKTEWGAEPNTKYYVLDILDIINTQNIKQ